LNNKVSDIIDVRCYHEDSDVIFSNKLRLSELNSDEPQESWYVVQLQELFYLALKDRVCRRSFHIKNKTYLKFRPINTNKL
jgi:hypothetical protein